MTLRLQASCDKMKMTGCVCSKLAIDFIKIAVNILNKIVAGY